jgi:hypothetical protein
MPLLARILTSLAISSVIIILSVVCAERPDQCRR